MMGTPIIQIAIGVLLATSVASAQTTYTVALDGSGDYGNIQDAVDATVDGDTVLVMAGTYYGTGTEVVFLTEKNITLKSLNAGTVTIHGQDERRGIVCAEVGVTNATTIEGFTITQCYDVVPGTQGGGAGMLCKRSSPKIINCIFDNNGMKLELQKDGSYIELYTSKGGGLQCKNSDSIIDSCVFIGNDAQYGGGLYSWNVSDLSIIDCTFLGNDAIYEAGGIYTSSEMTIFNTDINANTANTAGGMYLDTIIGTFLMGGCQFTNNIAANTGGLFILHCNNNANNMLILRSSLFDNNGSNIDGGAMFLETSDPIIVECEFLDNYAALFNGGAIYSNSSSNPQFRTCTFSGNTALGLGNGGGIYCLGGSVSFSAGTIFTDNVAAENGGALFFEGIGNLLLSGIGTIQNNSAGNNGGGFCIDGSTAITMSDFDFLSNTASGAGGGIYSFQCDIDLTDCDFIGNATTVWFGGGLYSYQCETKLNYCNFIDNTAGAGGGGLFALENTDVQLWFTDFEYNTANTGGGAVIDTDTYAMSSCDFIGNSSTQGGGGLLLDGLGGVAYCDFDLNSSLQAGGAIVAEGANSFDDCTFTNNTATVGGGLYLSGTSLLSSCTLQSNSAINGGGISSIFPGGIIILQDSILDSNIASGQAGGMYFGALQSVTIDNCQVTNNISNNIGGGLSTLASFTDIADSIFCNNTLTDIEGVWDDNGGNTIGGDCGDPSSDIDGDGIVGVSDLLIIIEYWGTDEVHADLDGSGIVDVGDILIIVADWGPVGG